MQTEMNGSIRKRRNHQPMPMFDVREDRPIPTRDAKPEVFKPPVDPYPFAQMKLGRNGNPPTTIAFKGNEATRARICTAAAAWAKKNNPDFKITTTRVKKRAGMRSEFLAWRIG